MFLTRQTDWTGTAGVTAKLPFQSELPLRYCFTSSLTLALGNTLEGNGTEHTRPKLSSPCRVMVPIGGLTLNFGDFAPKNLLLWMCQLEKDGINKLRVSCRQFFSRYFWVSAQKKKVLAFWAAEGESDRPQSACRQKSQRRHQNYSNWATAGDSSSCLLPTGPRNQNTAAVCLGFVSAAHWKQKLAVWVSWMQQDFLPNLFEAHISVLPFWIEVAFLKKNQGSNTIKKTKKTLIIKESLVLFF